MTIKPRMLYIVITLIFLCSCTAPQECVEQETAEFTETAAGYEESNAPLKNGETEMSETEIKFSEISSKTLTKEPVETSAPVSQTETAAKPVYDKTSAPVLSVSNVDTTTNYISWTSIQGAESYTLFLMNEETGEFEEYGNISGSSCNDKRLEPNTKYTYAVAARFPDGETGKLSEPASIYTYSKIGGIAQGNYIYYADNEDIDHFIKRTDRNGNKTETLLSAGWSMGRLLASENCICYVGYCIDIGYECDYDTMLVCCDLDGHRQNILEHFGENYSLEEIAVYNDMLFYSSFGAAAETDEYTYSLSVLYTNENGAVVSGDDNIYDGLYSSISFIYDENDTLFIAWQGEEIDWEASENSEYGDIITKPTGNICLYNADTKEKKLIPYADRDEKRIDICGYSYGKLYVRFENGRFGYISEDGSLAETALPQNASHLSFEPKSGDVFYEYREYTDDDTEKKELFCLSDGKAQKLAELYCDSGIDIQRYTLYGQDILYTNENGKNVFLDLNSGKSLVLNDIM